MVVSRFYVSTTIFSSEEKMIYIDTAIKVEHSKYAYKYHVEHVARRVALKIALSLYPDSIVVITASEEREVLEYLADSLIKEVGLTVQ